MKKDQRAYCEKPSLEVRGATQGRAWTSGGKTDKEENGEFPRPADLTPRWPSAVPGCCWTDRNSPPGQGGFYTLSWREDHSQDDGAAQESPRALRAGRGRDHSQASRGSLDEGRLYTPLPARLTACGVTDPTPCLGQCGSSAPRVRGPSDSPL